MTDEPAAAEPPTTPPTSSRPLLELRRSCTRFLNGHGTRPPKVVLAEVHEVLGDVEADRYGEGGVVTELETEVAALLGKPAAVLMPSGTMAQQIALRVHADRTGRRTVLWHPTCHLALWEDQAAERLHGLHGRPVGDAAVADHAGRPRGGRRVRRRAADRAAAARDRRPAAGVGRPGRADRAGPLARHRHPPRRRAPARVAAALRPAGGRGRCAVRQRLPLALQGSRRHQRLPARGRGAAGRRGPRVAAPARRDAVRALALRGRRSRRAAAARARGCRRTSSTRGRSRPSWRPSTACSSCPDPPVTNMMHVYLRGDAERLDAAIRRIATERGLWTWPKTVDQRAARLAGGRAHGRRRDAGVRAGRGARAGG